MLKNRSIDGRGYYRVDYDTLKMLEEYIRRGGHVVKDGKKFIFDINRHRAWQIVKECADKAKSS